MLYPKPMDLFSQNSHNSAPLADILRPQNLDEVIGQERLIGPQSRLGKLLRAGHIPSLILWGPPGTGKTSFALALAQQSGAHFESLNAVDAGAKLLREKGEASRDRRLQFGVKTLLFVDEIHRFNKAQQDVLLPFMERGDVVLIGATTENPSYELNRALLSRTRVLVFESLQASHLRLLLERAEQKMGQKITDFCSEALVDSLLDYCDGDGRRLLNALEILWIYHQVSPAEKLESSDLAEILASAPRAYDKNSEHHYDIISAFIKSLRGSDADAAIYYLARMLDAGEDPLFIARRLIISASEDVGNADPRALSVAVAGLQAVEAVGLPEGAINLAQVTTYIASCPKSNAAYAALNKAREFVKKTGSLPIPLHLRSARTDLAKEIGYGAEYRYPHDFPKGWVEQKYLPKEVSDETVFYEPKRWGFEKTVLEFLDWLKKK